jgi:hypothetical protein
MCRSNTNMLYPRLRSHRCQLTIIVRPFFLTAARGYSPVPDKCFLRARLVGTIRREWLDFLIRLDEKHLRKVLQAWVTSISIETALTRASAQVFWTGQQAFRHHEVRVTAFRAVIE